MYDLLMDLHRGSERLGPGSDEETEKALNLAGIDRNLPLKLADIGCGTGASTLALARLLNAEITAVDLLQDFLDVLEARVESAGFADKIKCLCCSMDDLPFDEESLDIIWSEGAIYNIGFERGLAMWRRFLKPGGLVVVSDITWTTVARSPEIQEYWQREYPGIDLASSKTGIVERNGYSPLAYFVLPRNCWLDNYYAPLEKAFNDFLERNQSSREAQSIVNAEQREINLYRKYGSYYSYGVYIARKLTK